MGFHPLKTGYLAEKTVGTLTTALHLCKLREERTASIGLLTEKEDVSNINLDRADILEQNLPTTDN
jgi:hypothetical protein